MLTIHQLNEVNHDEFMDILGEIFEHSPWIVKKTEEAKPFSSFHQLYQVMIDIVNNATYEQKLALIKAHPNLGEHVEMSENSIHEQKGAGLRDLTREEYNNFIALNQQYLKKFSFPFIIAVHDKNKHQIYGAMKTRIQKEKDSEFHTALHEIYQIARHRLEEKIIPSQINDKERNEIS